MAIQLKDMMRKTRSIKVDFQGETLNVTYRLNVVTPAFLQEIKGLPAEESVRKQLVKAVVGWDLLGEDGQALPVTEEVLKEIPTAFNAAVLNAIGKDLDNPDNNEKKD